MLLKMRLKLQFYHWLQFGFGTIGASMSVMSATHVESNKLDLSMPLLMAAVLPYYLFCIIFVICASPFLLMSVPVEYMLKDKPKQHGDAVVALMMLSLASTIIVPLLIIGSNII
jgi:hypothetical protein